MPNSHCPRHSLHSSHSIQCLENVPGLLLPQHLHRDGFLSPSHAPPRSAWLGPSPPAGPFFCDTYPGHTTYKLGLPPSRWLISVFWFFLHWIYLHDSPTSNLYQVLPWFCHWLGRKDRRSHLYFVKTVIKQTIPWSLWIWQPKECIMFALAECVGKLPLWIQGNWEAHKEFWVRPFPILSLIMRIFHSRE